MYNQLTAKQQQTQKRREQVYETAVDLFKKQGFEATTIQQISQVSGISVGSIYHFYENKAAILHQFARNIVGDQGQAFLLPTEENCRNPQRALVRFYGYVAERFELIGPDLTKHIREDFNAIWTNPDGSYNEYYGSAALCKLVEGAQSAGTFDSSLSAEEAVSYLQTACEGILCAWVVDHGRHSLKNSMERFMRRFLLCFQV